MIRTLQLRQVSWKRHVCLYISIISNGKSLETEFVLTVLTCWIRFKHIAHAHALNFLLLAILSIVKGKCEKKRKRSYYGTFTRIFQNIPQNHLNSFFWWETSNVVVSKATKYAQERDEKFQQLNGLVPAKSYSTEDSENVFGLGYQASILRL